MFHHQFGESHVILNSMFLRNILTKCKSLGKKKNKHAQLHTATLATFTARFPGIT